MSTTYMVKSSLVYLACHINVVLMTILFIFNLSKPNQQHYILNLLQLMLYVLGVIFNIYVVLYAGRKWELIVKYFENGSNYMRMMQHEIKYNLISSIKDSVQQISTAMYSILEDCSHLDSEVSDVADLKPVNEIEPLSTNTEEPVAKLQTRPVFTEDPVRVQTRQTFLEEISTKVQTTSDDKTPELKALYNLRNAYRPKSDPIKKTVKNEAIKAQSPELLKNKIFKSRMILTCDSPVSRKG